MTKYDQIMNRTLLQYQQFEKKCKNVLKVFPGCFDFPRNTPKYYLLIFPDFSLIFQVFPECCEPSIISIFLRVREKSFT